MGKVKKSTKQPKAKVLEEIDYIKTLSDEEMPFFPAMNEFRKLFIDHIKTETLDGKEIETIVFFDDTLENLKPVYDKYEKTLVFDEEDRKARLYIYMPLKDFWNLFEPALLDCGESLNDMLSSMITYEHEHNLGHDLFLSIVWDVRNPKAVVTQIFETEKFTKTRKFY